MIQGENRMKKKEVKPMKKLNQYSQVKRPNITLALDEHKKIAKYCIDNEMKIGDFLRQAALHCIDKKITF